MAPEHVTHVKLARALVILDLIASGCGGKQPDPGACGINSSTDTMTAMVDGQPWSSILTPSIYLQQTDAKVVSIAGGDGCTPIRALTFNLNPEGPGTYKIPDSAMAEAQDKSVLTAIYDVGTVAWDAQYPNGSGSVTFSTLSAAGASGTFEFTLQPLLGTPAVGIVKITNGAFAVKFTVN